MLPCLKALPDSQYLLSNLHISHLYLEVHPSFIHLLRMLRISLIYIVSFLKRLISSGGSIGGGNGRGSSWSSRRSLLVLLQYYLW